MLQAVFENILASAICAVVVAYAKRLFRYLKTPNEQSVKQIPVPKAVLKKQFFTSLAVMAISFTIAAALPHVMPFTWLGLLKVLIFIAAGYSIIFAWGAFEAALAFYPADNQTGDTEADHYTKDPGDQ